MGTTIYPTVPVAQPEAEPWPPLFDDGDEHTIRVDEMFARRLDTEFASGVRDLVHHPETGLAALKGEAALDAIGEVPPILQELKERTLAQAIGPRQRSLLERMIDTRLGWTNGAIDRLALRATVEVDDQSVADRIAALNQDAAAAWQDPAHLRKLGRTAVEELRYQGERRGWDPAETDTRVRGGLSDLYAGAVESAIGQDDLDGAAALYEHARPVLDPERQAALDHRFKRAREVALYRAIDRKLADLPLDPAGPPGLEVFQRQADDLVPDDTSDTIRGGIAQVADHAHRYAERQWHRRQADAGLAALDWFRQNPEASFLAIPPEVRDWLAPDQWQGLETLTIEGRLKTDGDLFEHLDRQMVHDPASFAAVDLDRHRLSLGEADHARFAAAQKAIAEGRIDPNLARYDRLRLGIDRGLEGLGIDLDGPVAAKIRADARGWLESFEIIEGRAPVGEDIDSIVDEAVGRIAPGDVADEAPPPAVGDTFDPRHIVPVQAGGRPPPLRPPTPPLPPRPQPGPGHNQPPGQSPGTAPGKPSPSAPQPPQGAPPVPDTAGPAAAAQQAAAEKRVATYNTYRGHLQELDPDNALLKLEPASGTAPDQRTTDDIQKEVARIVDEKVRAKLNELQAPSTYEQRSSVKTIGGNVDLREVFDDLKKAGRRVYARRAIWHRRKRRDVRTAGRTRHSGWLPDGQRHAKRCEELDTDFGYLCAGCRSRSLSLQSRKVAND